MMVPREVLNAVRPVAPDAAPERAFPRAGTGITILPRDKRLKRQERQFKPDIIEPEAIPAYRVNDMTVKKRSLPYSSGASAAHATSSTPPEGDFTIKMEIIADRRQEIGRQ
jgi:hypothetical protein